MAAGELRFEDLPRGSTMMPRTAKALTGLEVSEAVARNMAMVVEEMKLGKGAAEEFRAKAVEFLQLDCRLNKEHLAYPKVSWGGKIWLIEKEDGACEFSWQVQIWENSVKSFVMGSGTKWIDTPLEVTPYMFGQEPTDKPDEIRRRFGLPIHAKAQLPSGQTVTVILPASVEFGPSGLPTASAQRMAAERRAVEQGRGPLAPANSWTAPNPAPVAVVDAVPPLAPDDLIADPPDTDKPTLDVAATPPGSAGSIAKAPPPSVQVGRTPARGRK